MRVSVENQRHSSENAALAVRREMRSLAIWIVVLCAWGLILSLGEPPRLVEFDWGDDLPGHLDAEEEAFECLCVMDDSATALVNFPAGSLT